MRVQQEVGLGDNMWFKLVTSTLLVSLCLAAPATAFHSQQDPTATSMPPVYRFVELDGFNPQPESPQASMPPVYRFVNVGQLNHDTAMADLAALQLP